MKYLIIFISLFLSAVNLTAQIPDTAWIKTYNFSPGEYDFCGINGGTFTSNNDFVLAGHVSPDFYGYSDMLIIKADRNGDTLWTKRLDGPTTHDVGISVIESTDGQLVVLGIVQLEGNYGRLRLYKLNQSGDVIWQKTYMASTEYAFSYGLVETSDSGLIITGETEWDMFLLKTDYDGDSLWTVIYGNEYHDYGWDAAPTDDGGAIAVGGISTNEILYDTLCVLRINSSGIIEWAEKFHFAGGEYYWPGANIIRDGDNSYTITAIPEDGLTRIYKIRSDGSLIRSMILGNIPDYLIAHESCPAIDGGMLITGFTDGKTKCPVAKLDPAGDSLWMTKFGIDKFMGGSFIHQCNDYSIYIAGNLSLEDGVYIMKLHQITTGIEDANSNVHVAGFSLKQNYPNPFNAGTQIDFIVKSRGYVEIDIFNSLGQKVNTILNGEKPAGSYSVFWDGTDALGHKVASGMYYYRITVDGFVESRKMMLLK